MRIRTIAGLLLTMALAAPAFAESPFVGKWTATVAAPTGKASEIITVVKTSEGYALTAKLVDPTPGQPEAGPGTDIVLDGAHFAYKRTVTIGGGAVPIAYSGVVSGNTFAGVIEMAGVKIPFTGLRIADGK